MDPVSIPSSQPSSFPSSEPSTQPISPHSIITFNLSDDPFAGTRCTSWANSGRRMIRRDMAQALIRPPRDRDPLFRTPALLRRPDRHTEA
jgi:hypothetical protein